MLQYPGTLESIGWAPLGALRLQELVNKQDLSLVLSERPDSQIAKDPERRLAEGL
jgi:hypothetical protein